VRIGGRRSIEVHGNAALEPPRWIGGRDGQRPDMIDAEMLLRTLMAWLRGKPPVCSMVPIPSEADEEARRAHREREDFDRGAALRPIRTSSARLFGMSGDEVPSTATPVRR